MKQKEAKSNGESSAKKRSMLLTGLMLSIFLMLAGVVLGAWVFRKPDPVQVETALRMYVEGMAMSGKLVLVEAREKVLITQSTPGFLFGDTSVGRFLGIRSDATVQASAWADISFLVDLNAPESWSVRYNPMEGGKVIVAAPPLAMLTPAIHTDTIEISTIDRSIFLDESKLEKNALAGLTARFVEAASAMLDDTELRSKAATALQEMIRSFTTHLSQVGPAAGQPKIAVKEIEIYFATPED